MSEKDIVNGCPRIWDMLVELSSINKTSRVEWKHIARILDTSVNNATLYKLMAFLTRNGAIKIFEVYGRKIYEIDREIIFEIVKESKRFQAIRTAILKNRSLLATVEI